MSWVYSGVTAAIGIGSSLAASKAQKDANKKSADLSAAQQEFSPWSGIKPQEAQITPVNEAGSALKGGLEGGLAGYMQKQANMTPPATPGATQMPGAAPMGGGAPGMGNYAEELAKNLPTFMPKK